MWGLTQVFDPQKANKSSNYQGFWAVSAFALYIHIFSNTPKPNRAFLRKNPAKQPISRASAERLERGTRRIMS
jgi:hypothetical protein